MKEAQTSTKMFYSATREDSMTETDQYGNTYHGDLWIGDGKPKRKRPTNKQIARMIYDCDGDMAKAAYVYKVNTETLYSWLMRNEADSASK